MTVSFAVVGMFIFDIPDGRHKGNTEYFEWPLMGCTMPSDFPVEILYILQTLRFNQ
jgi:hypothetical protein